MTPPTRKRRNPNHRRNGRRREKSPPPKPAAAKSATTQSEKAGEDTSKKEKAATSASSAGSEEGKDKTFKAVTDAEYAKMDKPQRVAYNASLRQQNAKLEQELRSARSELQQVKTKPADNGRVKELETLLDARDKRLKEVEEHLRLTAYERSEEFKKQYQEPISDEWGLGRQETATLKVIQRTNEETGEVTQQARAGHAGGL